MACKKAKRVRQLLKVFLDEKLYEKNLKSTVFSTFLEVLTNAFNKKLNDCFSEKTRRKLKKNKKLVLKLLNKRKSLKKRKRFLAEAPPKLKSAINSLLVDFMERCVVNENDAVCEGASTSPDN